MALSSPSESKRDSVLSPRLSTLISLPPEPTKAVPLPPTQTGNGNGLPAPPTGALPSKPRTKQDHQTLHGFGAIVEEEEEEDDGDDEEFESNLEFEELVAVKEQQDLEQENIVDEASGSRPEYYATKERTVVEYIFPSESLSS